MSLQEACKANDIEAYLDAWDEKTKMAIDGRDLTLAQRRENRRKRVTEKPEQMQEIATAKIESITVDTSQAKQISDFFGYDIQGTTLLLRTDGPAFLFHETDAGWKLFTRGPADYFRK